MTKRPVHEIRFGLIKGTIWKNQTKDGDRHNITLARLFKNGDQWSESTRFGRDDLLLVAKICDLAHSWIHEQNQHSKDSKSGADVRT